MVTYDDFIQTCYDLADDSSPKNLAFILRVGNIGYRRAMRYFGRQFEERTKTTGTIAGQQYYQLPVDFEFAKSVKTLVGTYQYPTEEVRSQREWDELNRITTISNSRPTRHFIRLNAGIGGDEIGFWPIPSASFEPITFVFEAVPANISQPAFSAGQVSVGSGSATVTGNAAAFTQSLVGRYLSIQPPSGDGQYYRVSNYVSPTQLTIQNYWEGPAVTNAGFQIQDLFGLAEESQMVPVYYAMWHFYLMRQNKDLADFYKEMHDEEMKKAQENEATKSHGTIITRRGGSSRSLDYPEWFPSAGITP
jgi:hypothetical protein